MRVFTVEDCTRGHTSHNRHRHHRPLATSVCVHRMPPPPPPPPPPAPHCPHNHHDPLVSCGRRRVSPLRHLEGGVVTCCAGPLGQPRLCPCLVGLLVLTVVGLPCVILSGCCLFPSCSLPVCLLHCCSELAKCYCCDMVCCYTDCCKVRFDINKPYHM